MKTIETYCVSCKKNNANQNSRVKKPKQNRLMLLLNCTVCGKKRLTFIKNKEFPNDYFKMNKIISKFLLTGDEFMPGPTYRACGPFTKHCERIKKFRETDNLKHLYRNDLTKLLLLMIQHILIVKI